jgi:hypothetical protein
MRPFAGPMVFHGKLVIYLDAAAPAALVLKF